MSREAMFCKCPSCRQSEMRLREIAGGYMELCTQCNFAVNYVQFTCGHCNPDVFGLCPRDECPTPGQPTKKLCRI